MLQCHLVFLLCVLMEVGDNQSQMCKHSPKQRDSVTRELYQSPAQLLGLADTDKQTDKHRDRTYRQTGRLKYIQTDTQTDGLIYRQMDTQTNAHTDRLTHRHADWQTHTQADWHIYRLRDTQADWQTNWHTDRQNDTLTAMDVPTHQSRKTAKRGVPKHHWAFLAGLLVVLRCTDRQNVCLTQRLTNIQPASYGHKQSRKTAKRGVPKCHLAFLAGLLVVLWCTDRKTVWLTASQLWTQAEQKDSEERCT